MELHKLQHNKGATHKVKRLGKGESSGTGKTSGKGHKGQKARAGSGVRVGFEGGQMPLHRRLPRYGFNNKQFAKVYAQVNIIDLEKRFEDGSTIEEKTLVDAKLVKGIYDGIKLLGVGEVSKKFTVRVNAISQSAQQKIENAGGSVELI